MVSPSKTVKILQNKETSTNPSNPLPRKTPHPPKTEKNPQNLPPSLITHELIKSSNNNPKKLEMLSPA
jgi:hypothetical protein